MNRAIRIGLRLITLVFSISVVVFVLVGFFWYTLQDANGRAPQVGYRITAQKIEHAALGIYLRYKGSDVTQPADPNDAEPVQFTVEAGESVSSVASRLQEDGLVRDADLFRRVLQYWNADNDIESGIFTLRRDMTMQEIMDELRHGQMAAYRLTIPEGWRAEEVAALLERNGIVSAEEFMAAVQAGRSDYEFLQGRPEGASASLEGFLFPDTYMLPLDTDTTNVLDLMLDDWDTRVTAEWRAKAAERGLTLYEVVTLASIVEREAVLDAERPLIAGVYLNRVEQGMLLQADPTVQYALGQDAETGTWWRTLTVDDLKVDSPYNTYVYAGLPPGPICNPGLASIQAVLEPEESDYLYFVHKGDGSHAFATTLEEHLRNVSEYGDQQ